MELDGFESLPGLVTRAQLGHELGIPVLPPFIRHPEPCDSWRIACLFLVRNILFQEDWIHTLTAHAFQEKELEGALCPSKKQPVSSSF